MSKGDDDSRPLGICHRLIKFVIDNLIGQGHKRVPLGGGAPPCESTEVPISGGSSRNINIKPSKSNTGNGSLSSEVIIHFRHIEEPEVSPPVQKLRSEVDFPKKNCFISIDDQNLQQKGKERSVDARGRGKGHRKKIELPSSTKGKESAEYHREKYPTETTSGNESEEAKKMHPTRHPRPLLMSVASNINEKADAFIKSRKEAMNKLNSQESSS